MPDENDKIVITQELETAVKVDLSIPDNKCITKVELDSALKYIGLGLIQYSYFEEGIYVVNKSNVEYKLTIFNCTSSTANINIYDNRNLDNNASFQLGSLNATYLSITGLENPRQYTSYSAGVDYTLAGGYVCPMFYWGLREYYSNSSLTSRIAVTVGDIFEPFNYSDGYYSADIVNFSPSILTNAYVKCFDLMILFEGQ